MALAVVHKYKSGRNEKVARNKQITKNILRGASYKQQADIFNIHLGVVRFVFFRTLEYSIEQNGDDNDLTRFIDNQDSVVELRQFHNEWIPLVDKYTGRYFK